MLKQMVIVVLADFGKQAREQVTSFNLAELRVASRSTKTEVVVELVGPPQGRVRFHTHGSKIDHFERGENPQAGLNG
jgi:hypothetical protein